MTTESICRHKSLTALLLLGWLLEMCACPKKKKMKKKTDKKKKQSKEKRENVELNIKINLSELKGDFIFHPA